MPSVSNVIRVVIIDMLAAWTFRSPDGKPIAEIRDHVLVHLSPCGRACLLARFQGKQVEDVCLGSTRPHTPGIRIGDVLVVTNVFTDSRRNGIVVRRSLPVYEEVVRRLKLQPIPELVNVLAVCSCCTVMEYLDGYELLDNTAPFAPVQHRARCWADHHSLSDFERLNERIVRAVSLLHLRGIVHTDVTGFNVLVSSGNEPKIIDLFSCVTVEAIGPAWLPKRWKVRIGKRIEFDQMEKYLVQPVEKRWGHSLMLNRKTYQLRTR